MGYKELLFNIKLLHENREFLYMNRSSVKYDVVDNYSLDIFNIPGINEVVRYDIDCFLDSRRCGTPITIQFRKDCEELEIKERLRSIFLFVNDDYISNLFFFGDINKIDDIEYTLRYRRINFTKKQEDALGFLPQLIIYYTERYK